MVIMKLAKTLEDDEPGGGGIVGSDSGVIELVGLGAGVGAQPSEVLFEDGEGVAVGLGGGGGLGVVEGGDAPVVRDETVIASFCPN
jgi:hypothetical protein